MYRFWNVAALVLGVVIVMSNLCISDPPANYMDFVYKICNGDPDLDQSEFKTCLANIFKFLPKDTVQYNFSIYENSRQGNTPCYAHGVCVEGLLQSDCVNCLNAAINGANAQCGWSIGVQFQLKGCRVRFEKYTFAEGGR